MTLPIHSKSSYSSIRLFLTIVVAIFLGYIIRTVMHQIFPQYLLIDGIIADAVLDTIITFPILYFVSFRPLVTILVERNKNAEALRESEQNYKTLVDSGQALVWLAGTDKLCNYFNRVWLEYTGRTMMQEMGNGWTEGVHPDDLQHCLDIYIEAFDRRENFSMEYRLRRHDGNFRWILDEGCPRYNSKGEFIGYIGHCLDIHERKYVDEELRDSENKMRLLVWDMQVGVILQGPTTEIFLCNPKALELLGINEDQLLGKTTFDPDWNVIHQDGTPFPGNTHPVSQAIASRQPVRGVIMGVYRPSLRDRVWLLVDAVPQFFPDGSIRHVVCSFNDISELKKTEKTLRESEEKFRALFLNMTEGVALHEIIYNGDTAIDYRIIDINPAYEKHTGLSEAKARGLLASQLYGTGTPPYFDEFANVALNRTPFSFETYFPPLERHFRISVFSPQKGFFATVFEDITESKRTYEQLQKSAEDLKRSNVELEQFAYIASHDLQEPLRMISSYTQLLEKRYKDKLDQDANDFIGFAVDGANRMQKMIQSCLIYSRTTRDKSPLQTVDCNRVIEDVLMNLQISIQESGTVVHHANLPTIVGHPDLLLQLFQNLISNAIKFRNGKTPIISIGVQKNDSHWIFSVKDNGIGIDPQYFEKIFIIFQRLHTQGDYPGTGMGLSICKNIVERHHGTIWVESEPSKGTTFYFSISLKLKV